MNNNFLTNLFKPNKGRNVTGGGINTPDVSKLFQQGQQQTRISYTRPTIPGYNYNPHQIKTGDTFEKIAAANGTTVQALQQANGGMTVPPPKGSYVNIPYKSPTVPAGYQVPGSNIPNTGLTPQQLQAYRQQGTIGNYLAETTAQITQKLQSGTLPNSIPFEATKQLVNPVTGQAFTDADFLAEGYKYNNQTKAWELPGTGANTQTQTQTNTSTAKPWEQLVNLNGKKVPAYIAELMMGRQARLANRRRKAALLAQQQVVTPTEATNSGGLPTTTLDVQIGGG